MHPEVKTLTKAEAAWISRLEKVLSKLPSKRLELVTIGDSILTVIDGVVTKKYSLDLHDGLAERNGVVLGHVYGDVTIHGVSG